MGQRHQVYIRLPKVYYNKDNCNNRASTNVGFHHQWLYGATALRSLKNALTFIKATSLSNYPAYVSPHSLSEILDTFASIYSIDIESGYSSGVHKFGYESVENQVVFTNNSPETKDPRKGDNNNGITVIDLEDPSQPAYCFLSIGHLECLDETMGEAYDNFYPISALEWVDLHYGDSWKTKDIGLADCQQTKQIEEWVKFVDTFKVLAPKRLMQIFPALKKDIEKGIKAHDKRTPNSVKLIKQLAKKR